MAASGITHALARASGPRPLLAVREPNSQPVPPRSAASPIPRTSLDPTPSAHTACSQSDGPAQAPRPLRPKVQELPSTTPQPTPSAAPVAGSPPAPCVSQSHSCAVKPQTP